MSDIPEEDAILARLARAHKEWREHSPPPPSPEEVAVLLARVRDEFEAPEPQDVEIIRRARQDPLRAAISSQLSVVGWRLYAKGGADMLTAVYRRIERDQHPGFAHAVQWAWRDLGFPGDPRGVWSGIVLL